MTPGGGVERVEALVIGAGPAGLASAQCLGALGVHATILEKADNVGAVWRGHYDRLHLHTPRASSSLPGLWMPRSFGRYPSRDQVVAYLETYAATFRLKPRFDVRVGAVRRAGEGWRVEAGALTFEARIVVVAVGWASFPNLAFFPGQERFVGASFHSSAYRNGSEFKGKRVLVVGFGNSGAEIALDLCESGAQAALSVRSPVRILPRDLFGAPIVNFALMQKALPAKLADAINAPIIRLALGAPEDIGLVQSAKGPAQMVEEDGKIPVLDVGTVAKIRAGEIKTYPGIAKFDSSGVSFVDARRADFDAVIFATGFKPDYRALLPDAPETLDARGMPVITDRRTSAPGLYFVGARAAATGQLREIGIGARRVAKDARAFLRTVK